MKSPSEPRELIELIGGPCDGIRFETDPELAEQDYDPDLVCWPYHNGNAVYARRSERGDPHMAEFRAMCAETGNRVYCRFDFVRTYPNK